MFLDDVIAAGRAELHFLRLCRLLVGRYACVADLTAVWSTGSAILRVSGHPKRLRVDYEAGFPNTEDKDNRSIVNVFRHPLHRPYGLDEPEKHRFQAHREP